MKNIIKKSIGCVVLISGLLAAVMLLVGCIFMFIMGLFHFATCALNSCGLADYVLMESWFRYVVVGWVVVFCADLILLALLGPLYFVIYDEDDLVDEGFALFTTITKTKTTII